MSLDNIGVKRRHLMINEDPTGAGEDLLDAQGRDSSAWRLRLHARRPWRERVDVGSALRVAQVNPPGRDDVEVQPGTWESSGTISAPRKLAAGSWLLTVQAHKPTSAPVTGTFEDGQLLLMTRAGAGAR